MLGRSFGCVLGRGGTDGVVTGRYRDASDVTSEASSRFQISDQLVDDSSGRAPSWRIRLAVSTISHASMILPLRTCANRP